MNLPRYLGLFCCIALLHGCFDSPDKQSTKENTDGSKSSVQMGKPTDGSSSK
jgi:hypothetical protein